MEKDFSILFARKKSSILVKNSGVPCRVSCGSLYLRRAWVASLWQSGCVQWQISFVWMPGGSAARCVWSGWSEWSARRPRPAHGHSTRRATRQGRCSRGRGKRGGCTDSPLPPNHSSFTRFTQPPVLPPMPEHAPVPMPGTCARVQDVCVYV